MSGAEGLVGLIYQQRYVNYRVLCQQSTSVVGIGDESRQLARFSVEGQSETDGPIWDIVFEFADATIDLHECKDTAITKEDRLVFYDRLRRQIAAGTNATGIRPVWVTDPGKQTPHAISYLEGMAAAAGSVKRKQVSSKPPKRVDSTEDALHEAFHRLCQYRRNKPRGKKKATWVRPCTFKEAKALLSNLRVAQHRFAELDEAVKVLATGLFASGTAAAINTFVTGVLTERVVSKGHAEYSVDEFIAAVGTTELELTVTGLVRDLAATGAASGVRPEIRQVQWRGLAGCPVTAWTLNERLPAYQRGQSQCLVAGMGVGKTVASQQAFDHETAFRHPSRTLRFEARALDEKHLKALLRLVCMLSGVGPTWIAIDGLDEVPHDMRVQWMPFLTTLTALPT